MANNYAQVVKDLDRVISLIKCKAKDIPDAEKDQMIKETIDNFNNHVSPGWLAYRKSVSSENEGTAVLEWEDGGAYFYGLKGEKFLDCMGGFGIFTTGHSEPEIMEVVKAQLDRQGLHSQELLDPLRAYFAKSLADVAPGDLSVCFFTNCGTEAVEMALKLCRIKTGGRWYISTVRAFHGKTAASLAVGGKGLYREPYIPLVQQVMHVQYGVAEDIRKAIANLTAVGEKVAGVILEPIQGEAGVIMPPEGYFKEVRAICDEAGVPLVCDEVQTGFGRTGTMFRSEAEGIVPDVMTFGKAAGGGVMPMAGFICKPAMWNEDLTDNPYLLGSTTFGGNPVCCAAGIATLRFMLAHDVPGKCAKLGARLKAGLEACMKKYPDLMVDVRGAGLMLAVEFANDEVGYAFSKNMYAHHVIIAGTLNNARAIRFEPTSAMTEDEIDFALKCVDESLAAVKASM